MNYLLLLLTCWTYQVGAQDYGAVVERREYSAYAVNYHEEYEGERKGADMYVGEDEDRQYLGPRYTQLIVTVYKTKVKIEMRGPHGQSEGVYGRQERLTGPNWYGYQLAGRRQLVFSRVNARVYSGLEEVDGETVYLVEEVFMNPVE